jgi:hypothetical protein
MKDRRVTALELAPSARKSFACMAPARKPKPILGRWGAEHLAFLRCFYRYESGIPKYVTNR